MDNDINEPWVSTKEIGEHLGVTKDTIHKWIKAETVPCFRVGKLWKFKKSEVDAWIRSGGAEEKSDLCKMTDFINNHICYILFS